MPRKQHPHPDQPLVASWWAWFDEKKAPLSQSEVSRRIGKYTFRSKCDGKPGANSYLSVMRAHRTIPPHQVVCDIARAIGVSEAEALLQAGYAPLRSEEFWEAILSRNAGPPPLDCALTKAVGALDTLTPAEQRLVAVFLQGVLSGRQLAEVA